MQGQTMWAQVIRKQVNDLMKDAEWVALLSSLAATLNRGDEYPKKYVDAIFQNWERYSYDIYDAYCFAQINYCIKQGLIQVFQVPIGKEPVADRMHDKMNEILSGLSFPFRAVFTGGTQGSDGFLGVSAPVNAILYDPDSDMNDLAFCIVPDFDFPLEVGYMGAQKTFEYLHCAWSGLGGRLGVARWPYYQDRITVFALHGIGRGNKKFDGLLKNVYGDFDTLPNPWNDWWKSPRDQRG